MTRRKVLASLAMGATLLAGGCQTVVLDPLGGGGAGSRDAFDDQPANSVAMAYRKADLPVGLRHSTTGRDQAPDSVLFYISRNTQPTCAGPDDDNGPRVGCNEFQSVEFAIPPELYHVGRIYLSDWRIGGFSESMDDHCSGGGGDLEGAIDIVSISPESVELHLDVGNDRRLSPISGHYLVTACAKLPLEPPPTPGVAILGANLPPDAVEGAIDATALYVFAGTGGSTCADPAPDLACSQRFRTSFKIPGGQAAPGTVALSDVDASYVISRPAYECQGDDNLARGMLRDGIATFSDADADEVSFRIAGSAGVDGVYAAKICP